jgi:hypothetical protein
MNTDKQEELKFEALDQVNGGAFWSAWSHKNFEWPTPSQNTAGVSARHVPWLHAKLIQMPWGK